MTTATGGPSNLSMPGAKQHVGRVQVALICARTWHSVAWLGTLWHGWRGAKGVNEGRTDGAKSF
jgi:hypothetical protein